MKRKILFFVGLFIFLHSLSSSAQLASNALETYLKDHQIKAEKAAEGIYFEVEQEGQGNHPQVGDYVQVHYVGRLLDGKIFDQSDADLPLVFQLGRRQVIRGWEMGIPLFKKGAKGRLFLTPELAYGKRGAGKVVPPDAALIYEIELVDIMDIDAYDRYMEAQEAKERALFERQKVEQFVTDQQLLRQYVKENKLKAQKTDSGLYYAITKKGKGKAANAQVGDVIEVDYQGFLLNGTAFDASEAQEPYRFTLGKGKVIKGWDEGLQYFKKGAEGWLLIPSKLAYGPRAIEEEKVRVPANSILIFKIKVTDLQPHQ